jgi:hypothetical protein
MKALAAAAWTAGVLVFALGGCRSKKNDQPAEQTSTFDRKPESSPAAADSASADVEPNDDEAEEAMPRGADSAAGSGTHEPFGGSWTGCYEHYQPTSTPERDVMRLALLCGPENGMSRVGSMFVGEAADSASQHALDVRERECFRIFAVAGAGVAELSVEIRDADDALVARAGDSSRWLVLMRDGPLCPRAGKYTVMVRARRGQDRYALEIWRLP